MNEKRLTRRSLASPRTPGRTDWARVDRLSDDGIAAAVARDPDAAPLADEAWFAEAEVREPPAKQAISIRLDQDVLDWFRSNSSRYQSKINAVLRAYMDHERARTGKP